MLVKASVLGINMIVAAAPVAQDIAGFAVSSAAVVADILAPTPSAGWQAKT